MLLQRSIAVSAAVRIWVEDVRVASMTGEQMVLDEPDPATTLVMRKVPGAEPEVVVMGPRTRALYYLGRPGPECVKVRLRPGRARLLLGRSVRDMVDQVVPLSDPDRLLARHWADPARFAEALVAGISSRPADFSRSELVRLAAELLSTSDIQGSAKRLHVSERHLRNLFTEGVGMPPKRFARINRVRKVLTHAETTPWSELAIEAGYYDHSHMTAEFRSIMGVSPSAFRRGELPQATRCGP